MVKPHICTANFKNYKFLVSMLVFNLIFSLYVDVAPIRQLHMCVIKIVTFKRGHLMW